MIPEERYAAIVDGGAQPERTALRCRGILRHGYAQHTGWTDTWLYAHVFSSDAGRSWTWII